MRACSVSAKAPLSSKLHPMKKKSASQSAFFKLRLVIAVLFCFGAITLVLFAQPRTPSGQSGEFTAHCARPISRRDAGSEVRYLAAAAQHKTAGCERMTMRENEEAGADSAAPLGPVVPDTAVQRVLGKIGIPVPIIHFDGNSNLCGCSPPDPNGAVGPNHVVTMANLISKSSTRAGRRCSVRRRTIRCGPDLAAAAKRKTPAIPSCFTTSWPIAGCFRNLLRLPPYLGVCGAIANRRSAGILLPLGYCHRRRK